MDSHNAGEKSMSKGIRPSTLITIVLAGALAGLSARPAGVTVHAAGAWRPHTAVTTLTVFAAASLKESFGALGPRFAANHAGAAGTVAVRFNFGGSDTLVTQLAQGAPADVFASANTTQMQLAQRKGLIASRPVIFARNRLIVIVPASNPGNVSALADLGRPGVRLTLAAPSVPVGKYARAAFAVMARNIAVFGPGFAARVAKNVVSNELDVKAVASKVVLGEADAGVVYVTDVTPKVAPRVKTIAIPSPYNQIATYPIAVVKGSANATLAQQFIAYVLSSPGRDTLRRANFIVPGAADLARPARITGGRTHDGRATLVMRSA